MYSGLELARKAVIAAPSMKIIISSGYGSVGVEELEFDSVFLPKPYNIEKLKNLLADIKPSTGFHGVTPPMPVSVTD